MGLKNIVRHYKTIKFYIKTLLNIHNFQFCGELRAQNFILELCVQSARSKNLKCSYFCPPQSEKWIDAPALFRYASLRRTIANLYPIMTNFDAVDFSECRSITFIITFRSGARLWTGANTIIITFELARPASRVAVILITGTHYKLTWLQSGMYNKECN